MKYSYDDEPEFMKAFRNNPNNQSSGPRITKMFDAPKPEPKQKKEKVKKEKINKEQQAILSELSDLSKEDIGELKKMLAEKRANVAQDTSKDEGE